jgi:hypothetical protein
VRDDKSHSVARVYLHPRIVLRGMGKHNTQYRKAYLKRRKLQHKVTVKNKTTSVIEKHKEIESENKNSNTSDSSTDNPHIPPFVDIDSISEHIPTKPKASGGLAYYNDPLYLKFQEYKLLKKGIQNMQNRLSQFNQPMH